MRVVWTLTTALPFLDLLWNVLEREGWHLGLTGGVLTRGASHKDLDIVVYPRSSKKASLRALHRALRDAGLEQFLTAAQVHKGWRKRDKDNGDEKHVEIWHKGSRRVDVIVMGLKE